MYENMMLCAFLFFGLVVCASDDAALRGWLRSGNEQKLGWAYDHFNGAFKQYCDTYKNAPLNDADAIKAGQELLGSMPVRTAHEGLQDMQWQIINELEVRKELAKKTEERDYEWLINNVSATENATAHTHIAHYLVNNPSSKTSSFIPSYLQKLSKKDLEPLFDKALRVAINQSNGSLLATLMCEGISKKIPNVTARIADELFAKNHTSFFPSVTDSFIGTMILTNITAEMVKPTKNHNVVLLQSLLSVANDDFKTVSDMLSTHKDLMVPCVDAAEKLIAYTIKKPAKPGYLYRPCVPWNAKFRSFFNSCFKQEIDEQIRSSLASLLFKKYESNPVQWKEVSTWVCCAATQYMLVNSKTELSVQMLQRSIEDFAHLFSMHLKKEIQEEGKKLINGLYAAVYKNKVDKQPFNEQLLNINHLVLLASCKPEHLSDYLMAERRFNTIPLKPCAYDDLADVKMTSLIEPLRKSGFIDHLETVALENAAVAPRALRLLLHYDFYQNVEKGKEYASKLHGMYKKEGNAEYIAEAEICCKALTCRRVIEEAVRIRQQIEESYITLYDQFNHGLCADEDIEQVYALKNKQKGDPIPYVLDVDQLALAHKYGQDSAALSKIILSCEQARRFGSQISNLKWQEYFTPHSKALLWQKATTVCEKLDVDTMQLDFNLIAYAAYLNPLKSFKEKLCLLEKGVGKHPFCSLLFAKNVIENSGNNIHALSWDVRHKMYRALRCAIMQNQRSQALAALLDEVTQREGFKILDDNIASGDFGSVIALAAVQESLQIIAGLIGIQPFMWVKDSILYDVSADKYTGLARDFNILDSLETAAKNGNTIARSALFRIYLPKVYDHVNVGNIATNIDFIERVLEYGRDYIYHDQCEKKELVKSYIVSLINKVIAKSIKVSAFKKLKMSIQKL